jgi:hypothetical protein
MNINAMIKERRVGLVYNKLAYYNTQLQLHKDPGGIYEMAKDMVNNPSKYKSIIKKLKSYEQQD